MCATKWDQGEITSRNIYGKPRQSPLFTRKDRLAERKLFSCSKCGLRTLIVFPTQSLTRSSSLSVQNNKKGPVWIAYIVDTFRKKMQVCMLFQRLSSTVSQCQSLFLIPARSVLFVSYNFDCSIITEETKYEETIFILMYL